MDGTYKLFAAAILGLAIIFSSTDIGNRLTKPPVAKAEAGAATETPKPAANAPQPVIIPAPNLPPPPPPEPFAAQAPSELPMAEAPGAPTMSAEGQAPEPMVIIPAEGS
jgi:hypothetical protein